MCACFWFGIAFGLHLIKYVTAVLLVTHSTCSTRRSVPGALCRYDISMLLVSSDVHGNSYESVTCCCCRCCCRLHVNEEQAPSAGVFDSFTLIDTLVLLNCGFSSSLCVG